MAGPGVAPGFQGKIFRTREISIHYAEGPQNGPPLVLLHGLARDWRSFLVLLPELSSRFHVFALDLRGHGESSRATRGYRITQYAQDVPEFLGTVLPDGAAIFGHSLGGEVGMHIAAELNCRVTALIVGDSVISPESFARSMYYPLFSQLHELILRGGSQDELACGIGKIEIRVPDLDETLRIEELPGNSEAVLLEWARCAMLTDPDALAMMLNGSAFEGWNPTEILPRIACPTLLLQANPDLDALLSDSDVKLALKLLPEAEHMKFPLLGHALFMQQPKPVLQAVTDFMQRHAGSLGDQ